MVTEYCAKELERMYKRWVVIHLCSECGGDPNNLDRNKPHALQSELDEIKRDKTLSTKQKKELLLELRKILYSSSRCCGADFKRSWIDYYEVLYDMWRNRRKSKFKEQINQDLPDNSGEVLYSARARYGPDEIHRDDDFILMHEIWGLGDATTGELIRIFREEDTRQSQITKNESIKIPKKRGRKPKKKMEDDIIIPSNENLDFVAWLESW